MGVQHDLNLLFMFQILNPIHEDEEKQIYGLNSYFKVIITIDRAS